MRRVCDARPFSHRDRNQDFGRAEAGPARDNEGVEARRSLETVIRRQPQARLGPERRFCRRHHHRLVARRVFKPVGDAEGVEHAREVQSGHALKSKEANSLGWGRRGFWHGVDYRV